MFKNSTVTGSQYLCFAETAILSGQRNYQEKSSLQFDICVMQVGGSTKMSFIRREAAKTPQSAPHFLAPDKRPSGGLS